ncbi:MAG: thioredoxin domain-containing protein [Planctomycetota bacterium]
MRDYLLSRINRFEDWLELEARGVVMLPVRALGYLVLVILLMVSNIVAMSVLCLEAIAFCVGFRKSKNVPDSKIETARAAEGNDSERLSEAGAAKQLRADSPDIKTPVEVDADEFDRWIAEYERVLVDVWAPWCGPCRMMKPALKDVAEATGDRLLVMAVNATTQPKLAKRFNATGLPTLVLFRHGSEVGRHAGALSKDALLELVHEHLPDL